MGGCQGKFYKHQLIRLALVEFFQAANHIQVNNMMQPLQKVKFTV